MTLIHFTEWVAYNFKFKLNNSNICGTMGYTRGGAPGTSPVKLNERKCAPSHEDVTKWFVFPHLSIVTKKAPTKSDDSENLTFIKMDSRVKRMYKFAVWCEVNWHAPNIPLLTPPSIFQARGGDVQYHLKIHIVVPAF